MSIENLYRFDLQYQVCNIPLICNIKHEVYRGNMSTNLVITTNYNTQNTVHVHEYTNYTYIVRIPDKERTLLKLF